MLDESFLLCASGRGCDSTKCEDEPKNRKRHALLALLLAQESEILLVLDFEPSQVAAFYRGKYKQMSREVIDILTWWLGGQGRSHTIQFKLAKIKPKVIKDCNLKEGTPDPLLCQLAIACHGTVPIWTLDSDFWCASEHYPDINPILPGSRPQVG